MRENLEAVKATYGARWQRIRQAWITNLRFVADRDKRGIIDASQTLGRMAVADNLPESYRFIAAAAVEMIDGGEQ